MATKTNTKINGQEYYRIRKTVGHQIVDGKKKPIIKNFYGSSKGDAEKQYKEYLEAEAKAKYEKQVEMDTATLHDRAIQFIETALMVSAKYATGTKVRYESAYRVHIKDTWIDAMLIKDIHPSDIQRFYNELKVSKSTLKNINRFMSAFYKWMVRNEYSSDILTAIELPQKKDTRKSDGIVIFDDDTWSRLINEYFNSRHDFLIKLLCYSGMRIGECLALKYGDIRHNTIYVSHQYSMGEIKAPKYNSKREIPMHENLIAAYERHRSWHEDEMQRMEYQTDFVFTTQYGTLYDITNLYKTFRRLYKRHGIDGKHFHVYRATFCTKLCEAGAPLEVASKILGHKSLEVTAKHYALVRTESKRDAIALLR